MPEHLTKREKEGIVIIIVEEPRATCDDDADSDHFNCNDYNLFDATCGHQGFAAKYLTESAELHCTKHNWIDRCREFNKNQTSEIY
jgi:hypothetical protein